MSCLVLLSSALVAYAQDPGMIAAQQASQQAMQDAQNATQQAMQNAQDMGPAVAMTRAPKFSVGAGTVAAGTLVRMKTSTHYATIYYTTNGWTPTTASKRYMGPVRVNHNMLLQAIAVSPNMMRSFITRSEYTVPGSSVVKPVVLNTDGVLRSGTRLQLTTAAQIDSKTAQVGDTLPLRLEQDITAGGKVVIPKGTTVEAVVTLADPAGHAGIAGDIAFAVQPLVAGGITIPLTGGETLEGENHMKRAMGLILLPVAGPATLLAHGEQAVIKPGMSLNAVVVADTPLTPAAANTN